MEKKTGFGWGTRIFLLYTGFVAMIIFFVTMAMKQDVDLVSPDYYAKELAFQGRIDKINRTSELPAEPTWKVEQESVEIMFPENFQASGISGEILFFRPSEMQSDIRIPVSPDSNGSQVISKSLLKKGMYRLEIDWEHEGATYFTDGVIVIR